MECGEQSVQAASCGAASLTQGTLLDEQRLVLLRGVVQRGTERSRSVFGDRASTLGSRDRQVLSLSFSHVCVTLVNSTTE